MKKEGTNKVNNKAKILCTRQGERRKNERENRKKEKRKTGFDSLFYPKFSSLTLRRRTTYIYICRAVEVFNP